jgi:hypothetical protein
MLTLEAGVALLETIHSEPELGRVFRAAEEAERERRQARFGQLPLIPDDGKNRTISEHVPALLHFHPKEDYDEGYTTRRPTFFHGIGRLSHSHIPQIVENGYLVEGEIQVPPSISCVALDSNIVSQLELLKQPLGDMRSLLPILGREVRRVTTPSRKGSYQPSPDFYARQLVAVTHTFRRENVTEIGYVAGLTTPAHQTDSELVFLNHTKGPDHVMKGAQRIPLSTVTRLDTYQIYTAERPGNKALGH